MEKKFVDFNGRRVIEGWPEKIAAAQLEQTYSIGGAELGRIRYGGESQDWGATERPCGDCAVMKGQLHVPSCDIEECPSCGGQALACDCDYDGQEEDAA
jgi:hypothetical protein